MTSSKIDRRTLLRGTGVTLALPFLEAMLPLSALAQTGPKAGAPGGPPVRLAFLFVPNGMHMADWTPAAEGANFELPYLLQPLAPYRQQMNVLSGLTQNNARALGDGGGDHARSAAAWLTGCHPRKTSGANIKSGISADQVAAQFIGQHTRFPSLELGCERGGLAGDCDSGYSCAYSNSISWRSESTPVAKETDPRLVFDRLFGIDSEGNEIGESAAQKNLYKRSVLDFVMEDARSLSRQLGTRDRQKLDEYFGGVRELERRLQFAEKQNAAAGKPAAAGMPTRPSAMPRDYAEHVRLMGDMMVLAFQSDLTRICTFMFANEGSNRSYPMINIAEGHHELSHHGKSEEKQAKIRQINRFHLEQLSYIVDRMQKTKEGSGTLLDNTLLVYGGGISDGDRHNHNDLPVIVLGKGGGNVQTGRHIRYADGTPMTNLFVSMFDRVGVPVEKIGDSNGKLAQLF
ncbi:MAG TPA: DUF1552 domain-containing protein [Armatimonadaceae bacterium]|nr:DUF1552 domain-containing protein [Armatimonadaceae bacterium]